MVDLKAMWFAAPSALNKEIGSGKAEMMKVKFAKDGEWDGPYYVKIMDVYGAHGDKHYSIYFKDEWKLYNWYEVHVSNMDDVWDHYVKEFI